jgi:cell division transport system permease protein
MSLLKERIAQESIVEEVDMDMDWVRRLKAIMALGEQMVLGLAALLCLGVLLAIGNTIRLAIENRREEIIIAKLVGGTDGFVRRPFYIPVLGMA